MKKTFCIFFTVFLLHPILLMGQDSFSAKTTDNIIADLEKTIYESENPPTLEDEYYFGRAIAANILATYKPYTKNVELTLYLNRICQALVINSSRPEIFNGYHVMILDSQEYNAFATPSGHIFVTRRLIEAASSEDALAGIIAHELAHITLRHGMGIIDAMKLDNEIDTILQQSASTADGKGYKVDPRILAFRNSVNEFFDVMVKSGYSKPQEFEADNAAIALLAATGYDPGGLLETLKVLQKVQLRQKGGFNSTHPTPAERITNAEKETLRYRVSDTRSWRINRFKNK